MTHISRYTDQINNPPLALEKTAQVPVHKVKNIAQNQRRTPPSTCRALAAPRRERTGASEVDTPTAKYKNARLRRVFETLRKQMVMDKRVPLAVAFYWTVSILLVFVNKIVMKNKYLDAPLFLTWTQIVVAVGGCYVLSQYRKLPWFSFFPRFEYSYAIALNVMPLTLVFIGMIVFNNLCLKYVQVSFYQVARSLTIVFNVLLSRLFLGQKSSTNVLICIGIVVFGYLLGCNSEIDASLTGLFFGVSASVFVALYSIYVKRVLPVVNGDSWLLMIYNNMNALLVMPFLFILNGEFGTVLSSSAFSYAQFWSFLLIAGICGFLINIATFFQIKFTSPLSHNISGTAKAAFQSVLAIAVFGNTISFAGGIGIVFVLGGSFLYGYVRKRETELEKSKAAKDADCEMEESEPIKESA